MTTPKVTPIQLKEYNCKQSKHNDVVPNLPTYEKYLMWAKFVRQNRSFKYHDP